MQTCIRITNADGTMTLRCSPHGAPVKRPPTT
jgi:hypothetical protein